MKRSSLRRLDLVDKASLPLFAVTMAAEYAALRTDRYTYVEYVTGDSERPFARELPESHRGRFQLTVPAVDGTSVVLFGVVPGREQDRPTQLGNFKIRQPEPAFAG